MPNLPWTHRTINEMTIIGTALGSQIVNTHHFEASAVEEGTYTSDAVALAGSTTLADFWISNLKSVWLTCHPADYVITMVKCQVVERPGTFRHRLTPIERPQTGAGTGTGGGTAEELVASANIKWRTHIAGKRFRSRNYIGPVPTGWMSDGRLILAAVTAYTAYITPVLTNWGSATVPAVTQALTVYSRPYNMGEYQYATRKTGSLTVETPPDYAGNSTNVTTGTVDPVIRSQRRRQLGVGA